MSLSSFEYVNGKSAIEVTSHVEALTHTPLEGVSHCLVKTPVFTQCMIRSKYRYLEAPSRERRQGGPVTPRRVSRALLWRHSDRGWWPVACLALGSDNFRSTEPRPRLRSGARNWSEGGL